MSMKYIKATTKQIRDSRRLLQNPYAHQNDIGGFDATARTKQISENSQLLHPYAYITDTDDLDVIITAPVVEAIQNTTHCRGADAKEHRYAWIERTVRELHLNIWKHRHQLWPEGVPENPIELLDPSIAVKSIDFEFDLAESLGEINSQGKKGEVAGIIDRSARRISISRKLAPNTFRFTTMHEIGHALLHTETMLHRDRPIDGSSTLQGPRATIEVEADKFATYFLMPEKLIRVRFKQSFGVSDKFVLNDHTAFALASKNANGLIESCKTPRELARILAKTERYAGCDVYSLATQFGVSVEAMAIRIEELGLVGL